MQGHAGTFLNGNSIPSIFRLNVLWEEKVRYALTHFNVTISVARTDRTGSPLRELPCKMQGVQVCQRYLLLPVRKNAPGLWNCGLEGKPSGGATLRNVFVNIHPTHEARAARVAVNPGTLILMRLRHVQHTRAFYSAGSPHRRKHESSTEFTAPTMYGTWTSSQYLRSVCLAFISQSRVFLTPLTPRKSP